MIKSLPSRLVRRPFLDNGKEKMRRAIGRGKTRRPKRTGAQWMEELRGPVELP